MQSPTRYQWNALNKQQLGAYAEYFVKMEFTMGGFQVFTPEVDDRGVDFIARRQTGQWLEVQSKSKRGGGYIFMTKDKFTPSPTLFAAVTLFTDGQPPDLFLIPSTAWLTPNRLLVDRPYHEWGINLSKRNQSLLDPYRFHDVIHTVSPKGAA